MAVPTTTIPKAASITAIPIVTTAPIPIAAAEASRTSTKTIPKAASITAIPIINFYNIDGSSINQSID